MAPLASIVPLLFAGFAAARTCTNLTIPVDISSRQGVFQKVPVEGNLDVAAFAQNFVQQGRNYSAVLLQDYQTLKGSYKISAKFCQPDSGSGSTVQLLSHGIGFDKTYWDLSYNNYNYSYVEVAVKEGYSTLAIDRLGIGNSSHGDPFNEIQAQAEIEALNTITTMLRNGKVPGINTSFKKVIHVGHSFGSVQSYWLSALYPNNTDGLVLTGYSANGSYLPITVAGWNLHSARLNQLLRFGNSSNAKLRKALSSYYFSGSGLIKYLQSLLQGVSIQLSSSDIWNEVATTEVEDLVVGFNASVAPLNYPSGYTTWSDLTSNQFAFLLPGHYDIGLGVVTEMTKQPVTTGELLTIGSSPMTSAFTGPVLVFTGENDVPFCGGDCLATGGVAPNIPVQGKRQFPSASAFEAYIQPETAHGLNAHYNATAGYEVIQSWLGSHGLGA